MIFLLIVGLMLMSFGVWIVYEFVQGVRQDDKHSKIVSIILEAIFSDLLFGLGSILLGLIFILIWIWDVART